MCACHPKSLMNQRAGEFIGFWIYLSHVLQLAECPQVCETRPVDGQRQNCHILAKKSAISHVCKGPPEQQIPSANTHLFPNKVTWYWTRASAGRGKKLKTAPTTMWSKLCMSDVTGKRVEHKLCNGNRHLGYFEADNPKTYLPLRFCSKKSRDKSHL